MEWKWPAEHNVDCKDYHPEYGGGKVATNGIYGNPGGIVKACDSLITGSYDDTYHSLVGLNSGHIDFIFTFEDANTWCSGYRQMGSNALGAGWAPKSYTKKIEIYTGDANFGPWTLVATDTHSTWDNGRTPTFTDDGTTTEWTPTAPSKYLLVRTLTNHGDRDYGGRLVVRFLQLKFSSSPPSPSTPPPSPSPLPPPPAPSLPPPSPSPPPQTYTYTFTTKAELQTAVRAYNANPTAATKTYGMIAGWDVSMITDMSWLFNDLQNFNADISSWNTSKVTKMDRMFRVRPARALAPNSLESGLPVHAACAAAAPRPPASWPAPRPASHASPFDSAARVRLQPAAEL